MTAEKTPSKNNSNLSHICCMFHLSTKPHSYQIFLNKFKENYSQIKLITFTSDVSQTDLAVSFQDQRAWKRSLLAHVPTVHRFFFVVVLFYLALADLTDSKWAHRLLWVNIWTACSVCISALIPICGENNATSIICFAEDTVKSFVVCMQAQENLKEKQMSLNQHKTAVALEWIYSCVAVTHYYTTVKVSHGSNNSFLWTQVELHCTCRLWDWCNCKLFYTSICFHLHFQPNHFLINSDTTPSYILRQTVMLFAFYSPEENPSVWVKMRIYCNASPVVFMCCCLFFFNLWNGNVFNTSWFYVKHLRRNNSLLFSIT